MPSPTRVLEADTAAELLAIADDLVGEYGTAAHPELVRRAPELAEQLSDRLREHLRPADPEHGLFVLSGLPVHDAELGPTPSHWARASEVRTACWDMVMMLLGSVMGRVFGWEGQQGGKLVHNIVPAKGHEQEQTGMSSTVPLSAHSEDAFHPERAHLLMLGCLRNHDSVGTSAACVRQVELDDTDRALLSTPTLPILPDDSYSYDAQAHGNPPLIPTLWENADGTCTRFDPAYTPLDDATPRFRGAYGRLSEELRRVTTHVQLAPGDVLVIDNDAIVHGREPFQARYDGTDRWLKRVNIRVPGRTRPAAEAEEHGYGQRTVDPYA